MKLKLKNENLDIRGNWWNHIIQSTSVKYWMARKLEISSDSVLYRYWPGRSWNITFRWTAKRVIFSPKCAALRENIVQRENITLGTTGTWYFICPGRYLLYQMVKMNDFMEILCALWLPRSLVTRLGVCVQNKLNANLTALRAFYYDVLLLTTAYSDYAVHFFLGQFPNMELMLL